MKERSPTLCLRMRSKEFSIFHPFTFGAKILIFCAQEHLNGNASMSYARLISCLKLILACVCLDFEKVLISTTNDQLTFQLASQHMILNENDKIKYRVVDIFS